jgi:ribosome-associated translation inhibitor RaiA
MQNSQDEQRRIAKQLQDLRTYVATGAEVSPDMWALIDFYEDKMERLVLKLRKPQKTFADPLAINEYGDHEDDI